MSLRRFKFLIAVVLAAVALFPAAVADAGAAKRPVVVELYTSQGCSSCPPADAILGQLATRRDVIAMSLPITYWDMLGWKDTLASEADTKRQKAYAQAMWRGGVYTPQIIVDGVTDVVGGRDAQIESTIAARAADQQAVPVSVSADKRAVHVSVGAADVKDPNATIWLFVVQPQATVAITSGENNGHTYTYHNIVREIRALGIWKGQPFSLDLPRAELLGAHDSVVVAVQQGGYGRILGAGTLRHPVLDTAR
ncbi:MAG: DUF1223 domain-containing protein [Proteobacteria bacterium]|nr:DUF1223 domain-containing protein [Pseudomonadota bacterium]